MRHRQASRRADRQRVVGDARALEDAETLVAERTTLDTVQVEHRRVRGQHDHTVECVFCSAQSTRRVRLPQ